jgi:hypothetical protein
LYRSWTCIWHARKWICIVKIIDSFLISRPTLLVIEISLDVSSYLHIPSQTPENSWELHTTYFCVCDGHVCSMQLPGLLTCTVLEQEIWTPDWLLARIYCRVDSLAIC